MSNNTFDIVYKSSGDGNPTPMTCVQASVSCGGVPFTSISISCMDGASGKFMGPVVRIVNAPEGPDDDFAGIGYTLSDIAQEVMAAFDRAQQHLDAVTAMHPPRSRPAATAAAATAAAPAVVRKRTQSFTGVGQGLSRVKAEDAKRKGGFTLADAIKGSK
jgi:hypothetical protein